MRWFVEVSPLGKSEAPPERHCVDAAQWQKALSQVRKHAGHDEALRNFSIEVLDDGVRAVDPMVRLRYLLRRAPADAPITLGQGAAEPAPTTAKGMHSAPPPPVSAPPAPEPTPAPSGRRSFAQTMVFGSSGAASFQQTLASVQNAAAQPAPAKPAAPAPQAVAPARHSAPPPPPPPPVAPPPSVSPSASAPPPPPPPPTAAARAPSVPPPSSIPQYRVLMKRAQEPTAASPITYREMAFALVHGADEAGAERFIRARFDEVCMELSGAPPGKLVNLAVFDHVFDKKPLRPPVATLVWKDWKNPDPEIRFPMRPGASMPAPSLGHPSQPPPSQPPVVLSPSSPAASAPAPVPAAAPPAPAFPVSAKAPVHTDVPTPASTPIARRKESGSQPAVTAAPIMDVAPAPTTARLGSAPPPQLVPQPAQQAIAAALKAPATVPGPGAAPQQQPRARKPTPAGGVDIVAELFEVMHDLHFLRDVQEGAEFVQALALEKLQSPYAMVQLYDINRREFVVARAAGPNAASTVGGRTSERDPLITEIMQRRTPFVVDASSDPRVRVGRWAALGAEPALVLAAAVAQGGRFLGVLEVGCAPGKAYVKQHIDGMAYIADAFSEFLVARGIVFSADTPPPR